MSDSYIFDEYHPKSGVIPGYFEPDFHDIEHTASELLVSFSESEIIEAIWSLDSYLHHRQPDLYSSPEDWKKIGDPDGEYCAGDQTRFLNSQLNKAGSYTKAFGRPLQPFEAYAMVALSYLAMAVREEAKLEDMGDIGELHWRLARYAIEGSKLIYAARILKVNPDLIMPLDTYKQSVASKGGKGRNEKYRPLKQAVHEQWLEHYQHRARSNLDIARRVWMMIPDEDKLDEHNKPILTPANPEATIARWIADFKKGNTP